MRQTRRVAELGVRQILHSYVWLHSPGFCSIDSVNGGGQNINAGIGNAGKHVISARSVSITANLQIGNTTEHTERATATVKWSAA